MAAGQLWDFLPIYIGPMILFIVGFTMGGLNYVVTVLQAPEIARDADGTPQATCLTAERRLESRSRLACPLRAVRTAPRTDARTQRFAPASPGRIRPAGIPVQAAADGRPTQWR